MLRIQTACQRKKKQELDRYFSNRLLAEDKMPWLTIPKALQEIADFKNKGETQPLILEIENYINDLHKRYSLP